MEPTPEQYVETARTRGEGTVPIIRQLCESFGLSLAEAKECLVRHETGGLSLSDYQATLLPGIEAAFDEALSQ